MARWVGCSAMGRTLRYLGWTVLAATAWLALADALRWVPDGTSDRWLSKGLLLGLVCVAAGTLLRLLAPLSREMRRDHCIHCGAPTERGHPFCRDHLKAALEDARDRTRRALEERRGPKRSGSLSS